MAGQLNHNIDETVIELHRPNSRGESLSGPIIPFANELSEHYGLAVEPILATCLAVAGDAIGMGARLNTGLGADHACANLHVAIGAAPDSAFPYALSHILAPIVGFQ